MPNETNANIASQESCAEDEEIDDWTGAKKKVKRRKLKKAASKFKMPKKSESPSKSKLELTASLKKLYFNGK